MLQIRSAKTAACALAALLFGCGDKGGSSPARDGGPRADAGAPAGDGGPDAGAGTEADGGADAGLAGRPEPERDDLARSHDGGGAGEREDGSGQRDQAERRARLPLKPQLASPAGLERGLLAPLAWTSSRAETLAPGQEARVPEHL